MLTLARQALVDFTADDASASQHSWPLKVDVTQDIGGTLSPKVFVFHALLRDAASVGDRFEAIASIHQMADLPEDAPSYTPGNDYAIPFYRVSSLTFHCTSPQEADDLWAIIQADVTDLIEAHNSLLSLQTTETISIP